MQIEPFDAEIWLYDGQGAWHFVTLPEAQGTELKALSPAIAKKGFGSIKVSANIGQTAWETSVFPDKKSGSYLLPIKKEILEAEDLDVGSTVTVYLSTGMFGQ